MFKINNTNAAQRHKTQINMIYNISPKNTHRT